MKKRTKVWVSTRDGEWKRKETWEETKLHSGFSRERLREAALIWERSWKSDPEGTKEREAEQPSARDEDWTLPEWWKTVHGEFDVGGSREDEKRGREQLHKLVVEVPQAQGTALRKGREEVENVPICLWDGGWLTRAQDKLRRMKTDHSEHADEWGETWMRMRFWWKDVREWAERMRWRINIIEEFGKISAELLLELEKIDGSASANDFNVFSASETMYNVERCDLLTDYISDMKIALVAGDEHRFVANYKSVIDLMEGTLRSKGVKQGKS